MLSVKSLLKCAFWSSTTILQVHIYTCVFLFLSLNIICEEYKILLSIPTVFEESNLPGCDIVSLSGSHSLTDTASPSGSHSLTHHQVAPTHWHSFTEWLPPTHWHSITKWLPLNHWLSVTTKKLGYSVMLLRELHILPTVSIGNNCMLNHKLLMSIIVWCSS